MVASVVAGMRYFLVIFVSCVCAFALMLHVLFSIHVDSLAKSGEYVPDLFDSFESSCWRVFFVLFGNFSYLEFRAGLAKTRGRALI